MRVERTDRRAGTAIGQALNDQRRFVYGGIHEETVTPGEFFFAQPQPFQPWKQRR